jgi:hypothetical protein
MSKNKNNPSARTALHAAEDCICEIMRRQGGVGVVVGVKLRGGGTMTVHRGDLSGLSGPLRECIGDSVKSKDVP